MLLISLVDTLKVCCSYVLVYAVLMVWGWRKKEKKDSRSLNRKEKNFLAQILEENWASHVFLCAVKAISTSTTRVVNPVVAKTLYSTSQKMLKPREYIPRPKASRSGESPDNLHLER